MFMKRTFSQAMGQKGTNCRRGVLWATNGGGPAGGRFSLDHHLSVSVWAATLIFMAGGEVLARSATLVIRGQAAKEHAEPLQARV